MIPILLGAAAPIRWTLGGLTAAAEVRTAAIAPSEPAISYVTHGGDVFRSTDSGASWKSRTPLPNGAAFAMDLAVAPSDSRTVYAISDWGFSVTFDGAETWRTATSPEDSNGSFQFVVDPSVATTLHALNAGGEWNSSDSGVTWEHGPDLGSSELDSLAIDKTDGSKLYIGSRGVIFRSTDSGATWVLAGRGLPSGEGSWLFASSGGRVFAVTDAGLYRSDDGGSSFRAIPGPGAPLSDLEVGTDPGPTLYAVVYGPAVLRSDDGGSTFFSTSMTEYITSLSIDSANPAVLEGTVQSDRETPGQGVLRSTDGGRSWSASALGLPREPLDAVQMASGAGAIYVGTNGPAVFSSTDSGLTWKGHADSTDFPRRPDSLAADHSVAGRIYASLGRTLFRSDDYGASWIDVTGPTMERTESWGLAASQAPSGPIYAWGDGGFYATRDGGESWSKGELAGGILPGSWLPAFCSHTSDPNLAFASGQNLLYRTTDGGGSWVLLPAPGDLLVGLALTASEDLYASAAFNQGCPSIEEAENPERAGIYRSTDLGDTWQPLSMPAMFSNLGEIVADPAHADTLYLADPGSCGFFGGAFRTVDAGQTWESLTDGLPSIPIYTLLLDDSRVLHAGTYFGEYHAPLDPPEPVHSIIKPQPVPVGGR
jgi:photosystem II stability/assembly factor-like uncharacterized protein